MPLPAATAVISLQDPNASARQEIQRAAREIRTQVQRELQEQARSGNQAPPPPTSTGFEVPFRPRNEIPPEAVEMAMGFFFAMVAIIIGLPIARAFARRMDRKAVAPQVPAEVAQQLNHLAQAVDAIALEVERISEGQRFTTRLLAEQREGAQHALPTGSDR